MEFKERKRWPFLALPFTFTVYTVKEDLITINEGFLNRKENDCYMYRIQDVKLVTTLAERLFGLGTVICYTGDVTNPQLVIQRVKHSREIKNYLLKASEEARTRRRTLNTLNIGVDGEDVEFFGGDE